MNVEDKVHIKIDRTDLNEILTAFFKKEKDIKIKTIIYNVQSMPDDDSEYNSYQLKDIKLEGERI